MPIFVNQDIKQTELAKIRLWVLSQRIKRTRYASTYIETHFIEYEYLYGSESITVNDEPVKFESKDKLTEFFKVEA